MKKKFNLFANISEHPLILGLVLMVFAVLCVLVLIINDLIDSYPKDIELHKECMEKCQIKQIPETICSQSVCS